MFEKYRVQLESPLPIKLDLEDAVQTFPEYRKELEVIIRIVNDNRFLKGEFDAPYFTTSIRRNADAIAETYITEYILNEVLKNSSVPQLVKKFEKELMELEYILPLSTSQFSAYVTIMSEIFTTQKNKMSEFVTYLRSGNAVGGTLFKDLSKKCDSSMDQFGRIEASCVKKEFMPALCSTYSAQFKLLCDSQSKGYLESMTKVARTCNVYANKEEIPFSGSEVRYLASSIMHIEAVMIKYDLNNNNILDNAEAEAAYVQLAPLMDGFLANTPSLKSYKKKIYAYVLKFGKYPEVTTASEMAKFLKFLISFNTRPLASREALAKFAAETLELNESESASKFNCEYMKDPENIPYEM